MDFENYLNNRQQRINAFLAKILPPPTTTPSHLHQAMHYAVLNGGKRMRPLLVYATGEALGADIDQLDYSAGAIELIHAYSLVHDDLPAMDNDDLRRGKPTCHKAFDEATAILVGDALQSLAFSVLTDAKIQLPPESMLQMVSCLSKASGSLGMAGGQALDLRATSKLISNNELEEIHRLKTGALISACIQLGILTSQCKDKKTIQTLLHFAEHIGLCFQIQDDILDAEGSTSLLGKTAGSDVTNHKATFTTIKGLTRAKESLQQSYQKALWHLSSLGEHAKNLKCLADYIILRKH